MGKESLGTRLSVGGEREPGYEALGGWRKRAWGRGSRWVEKESLGTRLSVSGEREPSTYCNLKNRPTPEEEGGYCEP